MCVVSYVLFHINNCILLYLVGGHSKSEKNVKKHLKI